MHDPPANGPQPAPLPRLLLSAREAAEALHISARTLWQRTRDGEIPAVRIGRSVRYLAEDLRAWIERQRAQPNGRPL
jgi:excisionase family DNA binding protein